MILMDQEPELDDRLFYAWLAGFLDGEGCFSLQLGVRGTVYSARLDVTQRADDWKLMRMIWERTGLGTCNFAHARGTSQPSVTWWVLRARECQELARRLRSAGGLRGKKARDFELWAEAADILCDVGGSSSSPLGARLGEIKAALHAVKVFDASAAEEAEMMSAAKIDKRPNLDRLMHYKVLTQLQAEEIIRLRDTGVSQREIAAKFGVSPITISRLVRGMYKRIGPSAKALSDRLTLEAIDRMVARYHDGEKPIDLQREYSISAPQFYRYVNGQFERHRFRSEVL